MNQRRPFIAGNWKMNLDLQETGELVTAIAEQTRDVETVDVLVAPPFTYIPTVKEAIGKDTFYPVCKKR